MTGYTVHTGTSKKFTEGWDNIFDSKKSAGKKAETKKKSAKKKKKSATAKAKSAVKKKKNKNG